MVEGNLPILDSVSKDHRKMTSVPMSNKKMAEHISRWNAQQRMPDEVQMAEGPLDTEEPVSERSKKSTHFDYTDEIKKACLLCQRQFKTLEVLRRHAIESELHQKNLQDEALCKAGRQRKDAEAVDQPAKSQLMKPAGFAPVKDEIASSTADDGETQYRDRAQERRIVFGTERNWKPGQGKRRAPESTDRRAVDTPVIDRGVSLQSTGVGSSLLAKMGWISGQGLGLQGSGRVDPVEAKVLIPGAGLGSHAALSSAPLTVEEHSARQTRFVLGSAADRRTERMQERFNVEPKPHP